MAPEHPPRPQETRTTSLAAAHAHATARARARGQGGRGACGAALVWAGTARVRAAAGRAESRRGERIMTAPAMRSASTSHARDTRGGGGGDADGEEEEESAWAAKAPRAAVGVMSSSKCPSSVMCPRTSHSDTDTWAARAATSADAVSGRRDGRATAATSTARVAHVSATPPPHTRPQHQPELVTPTHLERERERGVGVRDAQKIKEIIFYPQICYILIFLFIHLFIYL